MKEQPDGRHEDHDDDSGLAEAESRPPPATAGKGQSLSCHGYPLISPDAGRHGVHEIGPTTAAGVWLRRIAVDSMLPAIEEGTCHFAVLNSHLTRASVRHEVGNTAVSLAKTQQPLNALQGSGQGRCHRCLSGCACQRPADLNFIRCCPSSFAWGVMYCHYPVSVVLQARP